MLNKIFITLILLSSLLVLLNYYTNPPDGYTGAPVPDELSCTLCHCFDTKHIIGSTEISGIPEKIIPGKIYPVEIIINNPDKKAVRTSFEFTALYRESSTGSLLNPQGNVKFSSYKSRDYAESRPGVTINDRKTVFSFDWQAPLEPDNSIISFYATSVLADGDNSFANDAVKETATFGVLGNSLNVETVDISNNICRGDSSGYAKIKISGGTPPYKIKWSNGQNKIEITGLKAGFYFSTVTDTNGFIGIGKIKISEPDLLFIDSTKVSNISNNKPGKIEILVSGGTKPYSFYWQHNGTYFSSEQNIYDLSSGKYNLTITDSCSIQLDTVFYIENKTATTGITLNDNVSIYPVPTKTVLNVCSQNHKIESFSIYDISNKLILKNKIKDYKYKMDVSTFKKGIYFIELSFDNKKSIHKIIIY
jgi:hypothetical protein